MSDPLECRHPHHLGLRCACPDVRCTEEREWAYCEIDRLSKESARLDALLDVAGRFYVVAWDGKEMIAVGTRRELDEVLEEPSDE